MSGSEWELGVVRGALIHLLGARSTCTLVETGSGTVQLHVGKAHDARSVSADGRFGCVVATGDAASVFERKSVLPSTLEMPTVISISGNGGAPLDFAMHASAACSAGICSLFVVVPSSSL